MADWISVDGISKDRRASFASTLRRCGLPLAAAIVLLTPVVPARALQTQPAVDSSAQASPIKPAPAAQVIDSSAQASPVSPTPSSPHRQFATGEEIPLRLQRSIDSGRLKNGQTVAATLAGPVHLRGGQTLPAGTTVRLTVISTVPAGKLSAAGEFSLQVQRVGSLGVFTDVLVFRGKPGHRDLEDSAPAVGTDAGLKAGARLLFRVRPSPRFNEAQPEGGSSPGSVDGVSSGSKPPPGSATGQQHSGGANGRKTTGKSKSSGIRPVQPAENTPGAVQHLGKESVAPNQPSKPSQPPKAATNTPQ